LKKRHFCLFKIATQEVSLWRIYVDLYYYPDWGWAQYVYEDQRSSSSDSLYTVLSRQTLPSPSS
jgi:hypothetical protein